MLYLSQPDIEVPSLDAAELTGILYDCVARAVTPAALRQRTVEIVAYPPRGPRYEQTIALLVLVSIEERPLPAHLDREALLELLEAAGVAAETSLSGDTVWGQIGELRFWIAIHKVPHSRGFSDVLMPERFGEG